MVNFLKAHSNPFPGDHATIAKTPQSESGYVSSFYCVSALYLALIIGSSYLFFFGEFILGASLPFCQAIDPFEDRDGFSLFFFCLKPGIFTTRSGRIDIRYLLELKNKSLPRRDPLELLSRTFGGLPYCICRMRLLWEFGSKFLKWTWSSRLKVWSMLT